VIAKPDTYIGLNESADLFPSQANDWNLQNTSSRNTSTCTILPDSTPSLLLFPSSKETGSPDEIRSNREMASPPCMASGDLSRGSTTIWTGDNSVEEIPASAYTGNDVMNNKQVPTKRNINKENFPSVINTLSTLNVHRKSVRKPSMPNPIFPSPPKEEKCSKNEDNNTHFRIREASRDIPLQNYQQTKTLPSKRRKKQSITQRDNHLIQRISEIAKRCERSVSQCEKTLAMMNELLRINRMENFWCDGTYRKWVPVSVNRNTMQHSCRSA